MRDRGERRYNGDGFDELHRAALRETDREQARKFYDRFRSIELDLARKWGFGRGKRRR